MTGMELGGAIVDSFIKNNYFEEKNSIGILIQFIEASKPGMREIRSLTLVVGMRCNILTLLVFAQEVRLLNKCGAVKDLYSQEKLLADLLLFNPHYFGANSQYLQYSFSSLLFYKLVNQKVAGLNPQRFTQSRVQYVPGKNKPQEQLRPVLFQRGFGNFGV